MNLKKSTFVGFLIVWVCGCQAPQRHSAVLSGDSLGRGAGQPSLYGNPQGTRATVPGDPGALLNPSNEGLNPRVVDADGVPTAFPLKAAGAQLHYSDGRLLETPGGRMVTATGAVFLNYGMRLEKNGQTYLMAWQVDHGTPVAEGGNATGWVAVDDMADGGAAALAAVPRRLGSIPQTVAVDQQGAPLAFVVNGSNQEALNVNVLDLKYTGFHGHNDRIANFFNLHDGAAGSQMLVNLTNVPGGGIAEGCLPNGTAFVPAGDANNHLVTVAVAVFDKTGSQRTITFIYGNAGDTWGWVVKDWLDP